MKEHSSPPPRPRSRLSSPSPSPLTPCYPQTGGVEGVQGDLEISAGVGSRIQISSRGELMPRLLSIRNWPRAKKKKKKRNKNPLCLTPSPALLSLLTGICSDIISWPVLCPSHIKWWARLITIQGIFLLLLSSTAKWKPLVHPPCSVLFLPPPSILLLSAKESSSLSLDYRERKWKSFHLRRYKGYDGRVKPSSSWF